MGTLSVNTYSCGEKTALKRRSGRLLCLLCVVLALLTSCSLLQESTPAAARVAQAKAALGLQGISVYDDLNAIYMGDAVTAFAMPRYLSRNNPVDLRAAAMEKLQYAPGWHAEAVKGEQVTALLAACCPELALFPAADEVFEAWYFCVDGEYPETLPRDDPESVWTLGFFDMDAGYWLHIDGESGMSATDDLPFAETGIQGMELGEMPVARQEGPIAITALTLPEAARASFLRNAPGWVSGEIHQSEIARLMNRTQEEAWPQLYPAAGVTFDRWCWVDRSGGKVFDWNTSAFPEALRAQGIQDSRNWLLAMVDVESGLLVFYEYDQ